MTEHKEPPRLPDVVDEAGNTPGWVPMLGLGLLCLVALAIVARQAISHRQSAAANAADGGTAVEAPAKPAAAPAGAP
jgi:hypothetical protein